jgi:D-apiose dehydrogenase
MLPRVAIVGAGYFAQFHLEAWQRLAREGRCELVAVCDANFGRAKQAVAATGARAYENASSMLENQSLDLLDIATPPDSHAILLGLALSHRLPTICQKPVAPSYEEARSLSERVRKGSTPVWIHENFRWMPWYLEMKSAIAAGQVGVLHDVSFRLRPGDGQGPEAYLSRQPYFQTMPRFLVHETLIHLIDTFRFLMGDVVAVYAQLRRVNPVIKGEDAGYVLFRFASGATGLIDANRLNDHVAANCRLTMGEAWLSGSKGVLRLNGDGELFFKPHLAPESSHHYLWNPQGFGGDCVYRQQRHVLDALAGGEPATNLLDAYMRNLEIEEAVYESNKLRREVAV